MPPLDAAAVMTHSVATVSPDDTIGRVAQLLTERGISAVPVVGPEGLLVGMISEGDLMRPFGQEHAMHREWWLNLLAEGTALADDFLDYLRLDRHRVRDLMNPNVITASESATLPQIADLLSKHRIKRVPILRDGKLVGIVSRADIIRALAKADVAAIQSP